MIVENSNGRRELTRSAAWRGVSSSSLKTANDQQHTYLAETNLGELNLLVAAILDVSAKSQNFNKWKHIVQCRYTYAGSLSELYTYIRIAHARKEVTVALHLQRSIFGLSTKC